MRAPDHGGGCALAGRRRDVPSAAVFFSSTSSVTLSPTLSSFVPPRAGVELRRNGDSWNSVIRTRASGLMGLGLGGVRC